MKAMIMAAGLGTRLLPLTERMSKPAVPVANRPIMEHIVTLLARHGIRDLAANLHYHPDEIRGHFGDGARFGVRLQYAFEPELSGTAGGVGQFREFLADGTFIVMSGDALTDVDVTALLAAHRRHGGLCTMAVKSVDDPSLYGVVVHDDGDRVVGFQEKPSREEALSSLCNCGIYALEPSVFDYIPVGAFVDFAQDVFPALLADDVPFHVWRVDSYWNDVGSLEVYRQGNFDALNGSVAIDLPGREVAQGVWVGDGARIAAGAILDPPVLVGSGSCVESGARLVGPVILGERCRVDAHAALDRSILWSDSTVGAHAMVRGALLGRGVVVGEAATIRPNAVLADGCCVGPRTDVPAGTRLSAATELRCGSPEPSSLLDAGEPEISS